MPHVTVTLKYTPKPEGNEVRVSVGGDDYPIRFDPSYGNEVLAAVPVNTTPAEALALARALTLVAGCADERWRGWHWEAREANGHLLATTPIGEWYVNRDDCEKAVRTLFRNRGTTWQFVSDDGSHESDFLSPRVDDTDCYEQLEDVPAGVTHVRSRRGVVAALHEDDGRWRGECGQVIPLDAGGPWFPFMPSDAENDAIRAQIAAGTTDPTIKSELIVHDPKLAPAVQRFQTERELQDYLASMNYDHGIEPELAIVDANGSIALACGTDDGDEMGYTYYRTGADGRMPCIHHAGSDCCGGAEVDRWQPTYPVVALGAAIPLWPTADDTTEAVPEAAWWCKRCDSENAFETCWFCKESKPADDTPEAEQ